MESSLTPYACRSKQQNRTALDTSYPDDRHELNVRQQGLQQYKHIYLYQFKKHR